MPEELYDSHDYCLLVDEYCSLAEENESLKTRIAELEAQVSVMKGMVRNARHLLLDEMVKYIGVSIHDLPDHYLQLKQVIDVLDGSGE